MIIGCILGIPILIYLIWALGRLAISWLASPTTDEESTCGNAKKTAASVILTISILAILMALGIAAVFIGIMTRAFPT